MTCTPYLFSLTALMLSGCQDDKTTEDTQAPALVEYVSPDLNGDGRVDVMVLGTGTSISGRSGFSSDQIAAELLRE